ncbi:LamG-like jellyroll fold domain-containing protein [Micromonospora sp. NPDC049559]|uniref:LamG-like jellyroll fold domain-containing protein n=1 Tax=Micromonospora sp. NPDC049559 TaxID=3155923 RepID=UPI003427AC90
MALPSRAARRRLAALTGLAAIIAAAGQAPAAIAAPKPKTPPPATASAALTREEAVAQAQRTGKPVDVVGATTSTDTLRANPDGTLTLTRTAVPVRKRVNGAWANLDATLHRNADGTLSPAVTTNSLTFSAGGTGALATMVNGGNKLSLTAPTRLPTPTTSGATATYANVLPGVDLQVTADLYGGFSQVFVVHDATAAANPALKQLALTTNTDGVTVTSDNAGNLSAKDRHGAAVFTAPAPTMWDSATSPAPTANPNRTQPVAPGASSSSPPRVASTAHGPGHGAHTAAIKVGVRAGGIDLTPDATMLTAKDTVYPLFIDPTWSSVGAGNNGWATVAEPNATTNYWKNTPDPEGRMQVGNSGEMWSHTLINFPIATSTLIGATIQSATFDITEIWSFSCTARPVDVYAPGTTLTSSNATWKYWAGVDIGDVVASANVAHGYNSNCPAAGVAFDVLNTINEDVKKSKKTQTFLLMGENEATDKYSWKEFLETSPRLTITYNRRPNTPTGMSTNPGTACPSASPTTIGQGPVTLYAPVSDPDGNTLGVTFQLWKTSDPTQKPIASSTSALTYASGTTAVFPVSQSILDTNAGSTLTQFSWHVQVTDTITTSDWSPTCTFTYDPTPSGAPVIEPIPTSTIGQKVTVTIDPPTSTIVPTAYSYQLNGAPPGTVGATNGKATLDITPTRFTNVLTVTSLTAGGNFGGTARQPFNSAPATTAADGDLTGDNQPDLLTVGGTHGLPAGLWLAKGKNSTIAANATDIGANGNGFSDGNSPIGFTGAQVITGHFTTGAGLQDVLVYYPAGDHQGGGTVLYGNGDGSVLQAQQNTNRYPFSRGTLTDGRGDEPVQIANAGHTSGQGTVYPDLIGISGDDTSGYSLTYYASQDGIAFYQVSEPLSNKTPTGDVYWNNWTIATGQTTNGTVMYLWNRTTGSLFLWTSLTYDIDTQTLAYNQQTIVTNGWNTNADLSLQVADINQNGTPDLWTVGENAEVTAYLIDNLTTTPTIYIPPKQTLLASTHTWPLNDGTEDAAVTTAADTVGNSPLTVQGATASSAVWHVGDLYSPSLQLNTTANDVSVDTTGTATLHSNGPLIDTTKSFSLSVWVKPTGAGGVIASEDGAHSSRFIIWDNQDDNTWRFGMATGDTNGWTYDQAIAPAGAQLGVWTHLVAVFSAETNTMSLYVNNLLVDTAYHNPAVTWPSTGNFAIGRYLNNGAPVSYYSGQVSNVQAWASALTSTQVGATNNQHALSGQWKFDTASGVTTDTSGNGRQLALSGSTQTGVTGKYAQALGLNGGYATTGKTVNTASGYTICTWANLDGSNGTTYRAIFSQDAGRSSGFWLRTNSLGYWEFVISTSDSAYTAVNSRAPATAGAWTHVCGVWDTSTSQMMIFINGALDGIRTATTTIVPTGSANIGRYKYLDAYATYTGSLDDVRTYVGAITEPDQITAIMNTTDGVTDTAHALSGQWKFDNTSGVTTDTSGNQHPLTINGAAQSGAGGSGIYNEGLILSGGYANTSGPVINTTSGYTVCAWAKLDKNTTNINYRAILSQDANRSSGLWLRTNSLGAWEFVIGTSDSSYIAVSSSQATPDSWTHLCGTWDNNTHQMSLFINGQFAATGAASGGVNATGAFNIGRYKYLDNYTGYFAGTLDDIRTYVGAITDTDQITAIMNDK